MRRSAQGLRQGQLFLVSLLVFRHAFTAPWTLPLQRHRHVMHAEAADPVKNPVSRLRSRMKTLLGRKLEPSDMVVTYKYEATIEVPVLNPIVAVTAKGDSQVLAKQEAANQILALLNQKQADEPDQKESKKKDLPNVSQETRDLFMALPEDQWLDADVVRETAKGDYLLEVKHPDGQVATGYLAREDAVTTRSIKPGKTIQVWVMPESLEQFLPVSMKLQVGRKVKAKYAGTRKGTAFFSVLFGKKNSSAVMPAAEMSSAPHLPEAGLEIGEFLEAVVYAPPRKLIRPVALTLHLGDFQRHLPDASQETQDLFMALPEEQWLDADVVRETTKGDYLLEVKHPDGQVATGYLSRFDAEDSRSMYPGKTIRVRVTSKPEKRSKMEVIWVSNKEIEAQTVVASEGTDQSQAEVKAQTPVASMLLGKS